MYNGVNDIKNCCMEQGAIKVDNNGQDTEVLCTVADVCCKDGNNLFRCFDTKGSFASDQSFCENLA